MIRKSFRGMALPNVPGAQCSNVVYIHVYCGDTKEVMEMVISKLYKECGVGKSIGWGPKDFLPYP